MAPEQKTFVFGDVSKHHKTDDCWVIISGKVYNVTQFMEEHPGGSEVILAATGKDATEDFEDTGHSDEAKELMGKYYIGKIDESTIPKKRSYDLFTTEKTYTTSSSDPTRELIIKILKFLVPFMILGLAFTVRG
ncbi:putative cytochrome b5-like heme/steroid binding domain, cytochrome b5, heme-binding protein [Helianthus debilis subsp. tardiflorus]